MTAYPDLNMMMKRPKITRQEIKFRIADERREQVAFVTDGDVDRWIRANQDLADLVETA